MDDQQRATETARANDANTGGLFTSRRSLLQVAGGVAATVAAASLLGPGGGNARVAEAAGASAARSAVRASGPIYMLLPTIKEDVTVDGRTDWLECLSVQSASAMPVSFQGSRLDKGDVQHSSISITRLMGKASKPLFDALVNGADFNEVKIDFCRFGSNGKLETIHQIKLENVYITSFAQSAGAGGEWEESIELTFEKIQRLYPPGEPD